MPTTNSKKILVEDFLKSLDHPLKPEIAEVRKIILASREGITEQIKWNAPSFCINGEDRVTLKLYPPKNIQLVFHRGGKVRADVATFSFHDSSGLVTWITTDRGVVTFRTMDEINAKRDELKVLVLSWMDATTV